ncbi:DUF4262 domain-containing protein [Methylobacterium nodulans]|uniref:Uncharacterized protein n=1 Tax=Methylobacterium nodulans (strain LMG 21967 / CNCM I-2342 / ORS 2060) TaxID=460265 RepID=B8IQL4_METNO|nr:DUF4262 domain-containing protein [Methylobacterium nodulans]ACL60526.1 hypothetical protein Mnod_5689 [Methylobacterium nodulans ORS 2060]
MPVTETSVIGALTPSASFNIAKRIRDYFQRRAHARAVEQQAEQARLAASFLEDACRIADEQTKAAKATAQAIKAVRAVEEKILAEAEARTLFYQRLATSACARKNLKFRSFIKDTIEQSGFIMINTHHSSRDPIMDTSFRYTVGFTELGLPELLIVGQTRKLARHMLEHLLKDHKSGKRPINPIDGFRTVAGGHVCMLRQLPKSKANNTVVFQARDYYRRHVGVLQVVLPDSRGRYPWDIRFDGFDVSQVGIQESVVNWLTEGPPREQAPH